MQAVQLALDAGPPIDSKRLPELSKGSLRSYLHYHDGPSGSADFAALWQCLLASALSQTPSEKYLTAACNCISVFLSSSASAPHDQLKHFSFSWRVWFQGYDCAWKAFDGGKTKPALQVLETLARLVQENPDKAMASSILREATQRLFDVLLAGSTSRQVKTACIALTCFIKKTGLLRNLEDWLDKYLDQVSSSWHQHQLQNGIVLGNYPDSYSSARHLFLALLFAIRNLETRSAALKLFALLLHAEDWTRDCRPVQPAAEVIELFVQSDAMPLGDFADNILPVILDDKPRYQLFQDLYKPGSDTIDSKLVLYLSVLRTGRLKSFLSEDELPIILNQTFAYTLSEIRRPLDAYCSFRLLLKAGNPTVRIHAFNLLTTTFSTIASVPEGVLVCLSNSFGYLHDDNGAYERGEILGITRRLLRRIESSGTSLRRKSQPDRPEIDTLQHYEDFIDRFGVFLLSELDPGISYPRHILALNTLQLFMKVARKSNLSRRQLITSLLNLAMDPFDDVRSMASLILKEVLAFDDDGSRPTIVLEYVQKLEDLSVRTCRHDHADAAGRLYASMIAHNHGLGVPVETSVYTLPALTWRLDTYLRSQHSFGPESGFPLHAMLRGLAYSIDDAVDTVGTLQHDTITICKRIWTLVQTQLCVDSPETASEVTEDDDISGPKDLLAYSWRALRDSRYFKTFVGDFRANFTSLLLQPILRCSGADFETLSVVGWLCMEQLTLLRHRGAFSTVAQTFNICCGKARSAKEIQCQKLNDTWCKAALAEIEKQAMRLTRRSAGLPAMICAVLSPNDPVFFAKVHHELVTAATRQVDSHDQSQPSLPQVHALNCLKDIMTSSRFRAMTEPYLSGMLELAAKSLSSSTWAIRNCGLMLVRSCINRLESQGSGSLADYVDSDSSVTTDTPPSQVAINLLSRVEDVEDPMLQSELIFAGLDLAKQVGPTRANSKTLNHLIRKQLGNPVWAVRDYAARLLAARTVTKDLAEDVFGTYLSAVGCSANLLHGTLQFFGYVVAGIRQSPSREESAGLMLLLQDFVDRSTSLFRPECSPYIRAAMFDVINDILLYSIGAVGYPIQWPRELLDNLSVIGSRLNETSNFFYRQRVLFYQILCLLLNNQSQPNDDQSVSDTIVKELVRDPDIARFVIDGIGRCPLQRFPFLVDLFVKTITATKSADVRVSSMMVLVAQLERGTDELSDAQVMLLEETIGQSNARDRELWNASLRLEGCLLCKRLPDNISERSEHVSAKTKAWLSSIRVASGDQLDSLTRLNAATAIEYCGPSIVLRANKSKTRGWEELTVNLLSLVYDQLNDDDEDVRELAQRTASIIIHEQEAGSKLSHAPCALSARELILDLLVKQFSTFPGLMKLALQRIVGSTFSAFREAHSALHSTFSDGVSKSLDNIQITMNDLFAEEKQNLYIDEVDEVKKWSTVLRRCDLQLLDLKWRAAALKWCSEGLEALISLLPTNRQADCKAMTQLHPMHSTYNADILLLFTRVVKLATILEGMDGLTGIADTGIIDTGASTQVDVLRQKLLKMRSVCLDTRVHRRVRELFTVTPGSRHP